MADPLTPGARTTPITVDIAPYAHPTSTQPVHPQVTVSSDTVQVTTRERAIDRGHRNAARALATIGVEIREARIAAGLSQGFVADAAGSSRAEISRIERAQAAMVPVRRLAAAAAVVGLDLSVRLYPAGLPLRDQAQLALLARFRSVIPKDIVWRSEAPLPIPGDPRAWDAAISGPGWTAYVDAETRLRDIQALQRRTALKQRDTGTARVILLVADTRANRSVLAALVAPLVPDALPGKGLLEALIAGQDPGGSGVILL
jgi:transcriptional regulator with XRE-family HTH domain